MHRSNMRGIICAKTGLGKAHYIDSFASMKQHPRKIAVKCNSHHRQGVRLSADGKPWFDFEKICNMDLFCSGITTEKPSAKAGGFSVGRGRSHDEVVCKAKLCPRRTLRFRLRNDGVKPSSKFAPREPKGERGLVQNPPAKKSVHASVRIFYFFTLHFSLNRRVRIFWKVISNSE